MYIFLISYFSTVFLLFNVLQCVNIRFLINYNLVILSRNYANFVTSYYELLVFS